MGQLEALKQLLRPARLLQMGKDAWRWLPESEGKYTVSSAYKVLLGPIEGEDYVLFKQVWSGIAPSNVSALVWKVVIDRIQSKANLRRRNIIHTKDEAKCVLCNMEEETTDHLFFSCQKTGEVWNCCYNWLGISTVLPKDRKSHMLQHALLMLNLKQNNGLRTIWVAVVWSMWIGRNNMIYRDVQFEVMRLFELIQVRSWRWLSSISSDFHYSFYEWCSNPIRCLESIG